jgi:hypothetical protein
MNTPSITYVEHCILEHDGKQSEFYFDSRNGASIDLALTRSELVNHIRQVKAKPFISVEYMELIESDNMFNAVVSTYNCRDTIEKYNKVLEKYEKQNIFLEKLDQVSFTFCTGDASFLISTNTYDPIKLIRYVLTQPEFTSYLKKKNHSMFIEPAACVSLEQILKNSKMKKLNSIEDQEKNCSDFYSGMSSSRLYYNNLYNNANINRTSYDFYEDDDNSYMRYLYRPRNKKKESHIAIEAEDDVEKRAREMEKEIQDNYDREKRMKDLEEFRRKHEEEKELKLRNETKYDALVRMKFERIEHKKIKQEELEKIEKRKREMTQDPKKSLFEAAEKKRNEELRRNLLGDEYFNRNQKNHKLYENQIARIIDEPTRVIDEPENLDIYYADKIFEKEKYNAIVNDIVDNEDSERNRTVPTIISNRVKHPRKLPPQIEEPEDEFALTIDSSDYAFDLLYDIGKKTKKQNTSQVIIEDIDNINGNALSFPETKLGEIIEHIKKVDITETNIEEELNSEEELSSGEEGYAGDSEEETNSNESNNLDDIQQNIELMNDDNIEDFR